jgi:quinol monooxygenase YgiN
VHYSAYIELFTTSIFIAIEHEPMEQSMEQPTTARSRLRSAEPISRRSAIVAQWEAKEGEADHVASILDRFLPEAQREAGVKLFLISRAKDNPAQFLFYELFRDEAAFKAHQESAHFKTYIAGQALPLLAKRERAALLRGYWLLGHSRTLERWRHQRWAANVPIQGRRSSHDGFFDGAKTRCA